MNRSLASTLILVAMFGLTLTGCKKANNLVQVEGVVNVDGKPQKGVLVIFVPEDDKLPSGSGVSNENGVYTLDSGSAAGLAPGSYKVVARWPDPNFVMPKTLSMSGDQPSPPDLFKGKYSSAQKTTVTVKIEPGMKTLPLLEFEKP